jgi:signal peptidase II
VRGITEEDSIMKFSLSHLLIIVTIFLLDRISKIYILSLYETSGEVNILISSFLSFNLVKNEGIAFGLLSFENQFYYNLITIFIILILFVIIWFAYNKKGIEKLCFLGIVGGALGNLFDRLYYSSVIDFIDISINNFHWFIFNIADIFISLGVIMLIILEFIKKKNHE